MESRIRSTLARPPLMRQDLEQSLERQAINPLTLSAFQRILLTTDGTVTEILEAFAGESIRVVKLFQEVSLLDRAVSSLELPWGQHVLRRNILLQGRMSLVNFIYAESVIALDRLEAGVREGLLQSQKGIGLLILERRIETFKEILECGREPAGALAPYFQIPEDASIIFRTYRMITKGEPIMVISEKFPESYFRDWDPTATLGTGVNPGRAERVTATEEDDETDVRRILEALEPFVRNELLGGGHPTPIAADADLIADGAVEGANLFALLAFIAERFGANFEDDDLVADNFRSLRAIAERVAMQRAGRRRGA